MKLLAIEAKQNAFYYQGRSKQVDDYGGNLYVLNGVGTSDFWPADRYRIVGSQHIDDIVAAAREWHAQERFDGVLTFAESAVVTVATVADDLGLPSVGVPAARTSRNKLLMREAHERAGVPIPRFRYVSDVDEALAAGEEFGYPVVIKPTLGAASHYVFRVDSPDQMRLRHQDAVEGMRRMVWWRTEAEGLDVGPYGLLVESFLDGQEHLFEALAWDDEVYLGSVVDRVTVEGHNFDDDVHVAPTALTTEQMAEIHQVVKAATHAQGVRRSSLHAEIRFHQGRPHLLEIAIRPGGGALDMVARVTADYCPIRAVMDVARGVKPRVRHYTPTGVHMMGTCLISQRGGELEYVSIPPEVRDSKHTLFAKATAMPGDTILRPPQGNNILGFLVVTGTSFDEVKYTLESFAAKIDVKMAGQPLAKCITAWSSQTPASPGTVQPSQEDVHAAALPDVPAEALRG
jgi:D-alanine-D-alanine ligase-like ATP-grasp enzyme